MSDTVPDTLSDTVPDTLVSVLLGLLGPLLPRVVVGLRVGGTGVRVWVRLGAG